MTRRDDQPPAWAGQLRRALRGRVAIVGIGNELKGDDAVGPRVARSLDGCMDARVFDAGVAPENWLGPISGCEPNTVLIIDAVELGAEPGDIELMDPAALAAGGASSHALSPAMFVGLLRERSGAEVLILAVQPEHTEFGCRLSDAVNGAAQQIVDCVRSVLTLNASPAQEAG